jgi:hypothetical protein
MDEMTNWITRENIVERYRLERITKSERGREERERERERASEREREAPQVSRAGEIVDGGACSRGWA